MKRPSMLAIALLALGTVGCSHEYRVHFKYLTDAPSDVLVTGELIEMPEGAVVGVEAWALEDDERIGDRVDLIPARPGIVGIDFGLEERTFVLYGIALGATSVDVYFNDDLVGEISAQTIEQR
jgi:hypothetical protein